MPTPSDTASLAQAQADPDAAEMLREAWGELAEDVAAGTPYHTAYADMERVWADNLRELYGAGDTDWAWVAETLLAEHQPA